MPYYLIGKIVVWGGLFIGYFFLTHFAFKRFAEIYRFTLLGCHSYTTRRYWIENIQNNVVYWLHQLTLSERVSVELTAAVLSVFLVLILNTFGLLELGIRYLFKLVRKSFAPTVAQ